MIQTDLLPATGTLGLAIGLVLSLVCYLSTNVFPGGMLNQVPLLFTYQALGFVIPGLITYQLLRQPARPTAVATVAVTGVTYGVLISGVSAGLVPVI